MISKNLYIKTIFFILALLILNLGSGAIVILRSDYYILLLSLPLMAWVCMAMLRHLNKTNRQIAYFINAIRNEDTSLQIPKDLNSKSTNELYNSLKLFNEKLKQTKMKVSYNEQLLKTLIENSSGGFLTIDEQGNFEVLNHTARDILGVEYTTNLMRLKEINPSLHQIFDSINPGEKRTLRLNTNNKVNVLSISAAEIKYLNKSFKIISMQDISRELDEQELESWHKLFRVITHEIMNSIAPITSLTKKLISNFEKEEKTDNQYKKTLKGLYVIDDMSNGLMHFVSNYRQLNKVPQPKISSIEIVPWLGKLKTLLLEMETDHKPKMTISVEASCHYIYADENLLSQVIINLYLNAIQALKENDNGTIELKVKLNEKGKTELQFCDNGEGISPENIDKVFVPFFTTKEDGNGIGLSLSKQIIRLHGGQINISSTKDKGTKVTILI